MLKRVQHRPCAKSYAGDREYDPYQHANAIAAYECANARSDQPNGQGSDSDPAPGLPDSNDNRPPPKTDGTRD